MHRPAKCLGICVEFAFFRIVSPSSRDSTGRQNKLLNKWLPIVKIAVMALLAPRCLSTQRGLSCDQFLGAELLSPGKS